METPLWVPQFKIDYEWELPWIRGLSINKLFVADAKFRLVAETRGSPIMDGILRVDKNAGVFLKNAFVFGAVEFPLRRPLFVCIVDKVDWT